MSAPWLRAQIDVLLANEKLRSNAAELGKKVRSEDGLGEASRAIQAALARPDT